ncbi:glycerophosphodiester phosphodiesterase family protein [Agrobacterium larrymoorei]|uniref:glycerophosphodiester phosphodiesterase family protein n=1 Tax=Agrobacterium larrymoorei TaxID=160699 RepID=UPI00286CF3DB|nr:glycerophosphodiester phosphodiesterase family protein [Agrobacterium larrymoorei]
MRARVLRYQHARRRKCFLLSGIAFLVALAFSTTHLYLPRGSNFEVSPPPAHSGTFPSLREIRTHSNTGIIEKWPALSLAEQRLHRQVIVHRGLSGNFCDEVLPESSSEAGLRALNWGYGILEVDVAVDREENLLVIHDKNGFRQTQGQHLWRDVRFDELADGLKRYVWRKIENGQYTVEALETSFFVRSLDDYIAHTVAKYPGATLLLDCRDNDPIPTIRHLSNRPELFKKVIVQIYDFGFSSGYDFVRRIEASGAAPGWQNIHLVISPHPDGISKLPDIDENDPLNANATLTAVWQWANSFENLGLKIFGADVPQTGFHKHYDPFTRTVSHDHFPDERLNFQERLAVFYDWVLHQFAIEYKRRHPRRLLIAPASTYTVGVAGDLLRSAFHTGMLTALDPDDLRHRMFLDASLPQTVFECGADAAISDRPHDAVAYLSNGRRLKAPEGYRYPPNEVGDFGLPQFRREIGRKDQPHGCYPEPIAV